MSKIDKNSRMPLYCQLVEVLIQDIQADKYMENEKIPSERELCELYGLSRVTVRQAVSELVNMRILKKEHGRGTFVTPKMNQDLQKFYSFTDEMKKLGKKPWSKVLGFKIIPCKLKVARKLGINADEDVYEIIRLRLADDVPMMYERTYLPVSRFRGLTKEDVSSQPMYDVFRNKFKMFFSKAEEVLKPVQTRDYEAELLDVSVHIPSMMIERITYEADQVIEYTVSIVRGDQIQYRVILD